MGGVGGTSPRHPGRILHPYSYLGYPDSGGSYRRFPANMQICSYRCLTPAHQWVGGLGVPPPLHNFSGRGGRGAPDREGTREPPCLARGMIMFFRRNQTGNEPIHGGVPPPPGAFSRGSPIAPDPADTTQERSAVAGDVPAAGHDRSSPRSPGHGPRSPVQCRANRDAVHSLHPYRAVTLPALQLPARKVNRFCPW